MGISVDIRKKMGDFTLNIQFESHASRIGVLGASGCGKSLTLKNIAGIERPEKGRIVIDDRVLYDSATRVCLKPQKRNVGYMFQNYALFPTMTVEENIAAGLRYSRGLRKSNESRGDRIAGRVEEMIARFSLQGLEKHLPEQLSGGQQQRVALARIMACSPDVILLDEPFSALDQHLSERLQHEMMEMLEEYPGQVIMVSHSRDEIYRFAEDIMILDEGRVIAFGKTREIFENPGTAEVARITGCKNITEALRIDDHTLRLPRWGTELKFAESIPAGVCGIGYRAHYFEPVWGEREDNCIPLRISGIDELPFERRYYIKPSGDHGDREDSESICWFVQESERRRLDEREKPDYLKLRVEDVMFLT